MKILLRKKSKDRMSFQIRLNLHRQIGNLEIDNGLIVFLCLFGQMEGYIQTKTFLSTPKRGVR